ncbi:MAG TPA: 16S rRNA (cytosine(967)-C(5))-methyltransferase RsmB [Bacillota bacterium]|nr:16S rRNA (cytosine(967)-C(5))-methyltransferase RsmB [Bacillota bacterium]
MANNMREAALNVLLRIDNHGGYSHLLIDREMNLNNISEQDKRLFTEIVYGTLERKLTIDYYLEPFIKRQKKLKDWVRMLLRMSVYQMIFLDKVPPYAIINEAVEIAKKNGHKGISSLINGVLRNIDRKGVQSTEDISDPVERLSIETSHPQWLIERWIKQYGYEVTQAIANNHLQRTLMTVRIQPLKITREQAIEQLFDEGLTVEKSTLSDQGIIIQSGNVLKTRLYKEGYLTIQDESSMLVGHYLEVLRGMTVLDACSAPGGKVTHIAELMENEGYIKAYDIHKKKLKLIHEKTKSLNISIVDPVVGDARELRDKEAAESFDRILIDAPCSGLGVIRSKPDLKYSKTKEDISRLASIQQSILNNVLSLLKSDGKLVYSTCTIDKEENEYLVKQFLEENDEFEVDPTFIASIPQSLQSGVTPYGLQLLPQMINSDGFFITRLQRVKK